MDLKIEGSEAVVKPFSRSIKELAAVEVKDVENIDEIAAAIIGECDPAYLVTAGNRDGLLESIGIEYVMEYFDLYQKREDYGVSNKDF